MKIRGALAVLSLLYGPDDERLRAAFEAVRDHAIDMRATGPEETPDA